MIICNNEGDKQSPTLIGGNLYQYTREGSDYNGNIYIYAEGPVDKLICLDTGSYWAGEGFGVSGHLFINVTNQYCLKKI